MKLLTSMRGKGRMDSRACRMAFHFADEKRLPAGFGGRPADRLLTTGAAGLCFHVGLGPQDKFDADALRRAAAEAALEARTRRIRRVCLDLADWPGRDAAGAAEIIAESARLSQYRYSLSSQAPEDLPLESLVVLCRTVAEHRSLTAALKKISCVADAVDLTRTISNLPGNLAAPEGIAKMAARLRSPSIRVRILGRQACAKLGMNAFLSVAQGSHRPPAFVVLEYHPARASNRRPIALVGKGVTFDSGGISIKPAERMEEMKHDKSGAAAVIGIFSAARALKPRIPMVGVIPLTENLPGGRAGRPGDVVRSLSGKTIEIKNTDAEGRLILADALTYAGRFRPEAIIDMATLTGACSIALGDVYAAILSNNDALAASLIVAGESCGERLWRLPLHDAYDRLIKSQVADVQNIPEGKLAGTVIGGMFLKKFLTDDRTPWAHIDIAATAWDVKGRDGRPAGSTGIGVRLFYEFLNIRGDLP